jgi:hypothetical protein
MLQNECFTTSAEFDALAGTAWLEFFGYFSPPLFQHPAATALGLRLPYFAFYDNMNIEEPLRRLQSVEIAADQLADNRADSVELAERYWYNIGLWPLQQDGSMPSILSPTDVFLSGKELRTRITAIEPTLQGMEDIHDPARG